jgi:superfamily II DNA helicase RecQ
MTGATLRTTIDRLSSYEVRSAELLRRMKPASTKTRPCRAIDGLAVFAGYCCAHDETCEYLTRRLSKMRDHMRVHGKKPSQHRVEAPLWRECKLQTYFTAKGLIDYFVVAADQPTPSAAAAVGHGSNLAAPAAEEEEEEETKLFDELRQDLEEAARDLEEKADIVQDEEASRADRVPWLGRTGFPAHLRGLRDADIKSSYALPPKKVLDKWAARRSSRDGKTREGEEQAEAKAKAKVGSGAGEEGEEEEEDTDLVAILVAAESMLRDAYDVCSDMSPGRKMTQQRANILNGFYAGASSKASGFRHFKNQSTLTTYFKRTKQLLAFYYRVVYREDGHFPRDGASQVVPRDVIEPTGTQRRAMKEVMDIVRHRDGDSASRGDDDDAERRERELKHAIRRLYMALICHTVGSSPFRSPVLSFCAMLSRKVFGMGKKNEGGRGGIRSRRRMHGLWAEPGNFNSCLSALTWSAQLVLFDYACYHQRDNENGIPGLLRELCDGFFQQLAETPFGHILQWRLYLFEVGKEAIAKDQARWSLDGQTIEYQGTKLRLSQVTELMAAEYRQAYSILYDELLLGARNLAPIRAWMVHDDLDLDEYGGSWLTDARNADLLQGSQQALLRHIEGNAELRRTFVRAATGGGDGDDNGKRPAVGLCGKAIAIYEARVQAFLKSMSLLHHMPTGPPVRVTELLSMLWTNTARRRNIFVWEKMVMVHVRYHKGQEQQGAGRDNIRFLPQAVGDLLLTFLAYVQPLRQVFLRQGKPGALLSPYLWSKLDGETWKDGSISSCLRKACARAAVPPFQVAWWRQVAASVTKEKFGARERANFQQEGSAGGAAEAEEIEDEADLIQLAQMSNHSFHTFNHAYAGTNTVAMSTLLHRGYRASESWRSLFGIDEALQEPKPPGKRPRSASDSEPEQPVLLPACKKARFRVRPTACEGRLVAAARRLYGNPTLQFRQPGQRNGVLATLGPGAGEQVVVVLATGSGKTLIVEVGSALDGAETTILVLPTVALRNHMVDRLRKDGLRCHVWAPGSTRRAPVVIVSAEAACTQSFLEYAHRRADLQQLDRIVMDESHLTVTASEYRKCMSRLGWFVRQIRTQTVWLTATLPPAFEDLFFQVNKLVRPVVVRESTNRRNIRYVVQQRDASDEAPLCERVVRIARSWRSRADLFEGEQDRMIVYCESRRMAAEMATLLGCPSYTAETGLDDDEAEVQKDAVIQQWLQRATDPPAIVATSALGVGFDYGRVRWVIHAGDPSLMTSFSQESGRAGRDGRRAESLVLRGRTGRTGGPEGQRGADEAAMDLYLTQQHCSRGVMSQFLDAEADWTWCGQGDELCGVCPKPHASGRPGGMRFSAAPAAAPDSGTGPGEVLRQDQVDSEVASRYERDLETMAGCCLYCRVEGRAFEHAARRCARRHDWIRAKQAALAACRSEGREWMGRYAVCWKCYQPQEICRAADPEEEEAAAGAACRFPDAVIPLCYAVFGRQGRTKWFRQHFKVGFKTRHEYMIWLGTSGMLGGMRCVQANCVAALVLAELS